MKRKQNPVVLCVILSVFLSNASFAADPPGFIDYPVSGISDKKLKSVNLGSQPKAKLFRTMLNKAVGQSANFAGHYVVQTWGCGSNCKAIALIDVNNGQVFFAPFSIGLGSEFQANSRLFLVEPPLAIQEYYDGDPNVPGRLFYSYYYVWNETKKVFQLVYTDDPAHSQDQTQTSVLFTFSTSSSPRPLLLRCMQATPIQNVEDCVKAELTVSEAKLEKYFMEAFRLLTVTGQRALERSQRAWLTYRYEQCEAMSQLYFSKTIVDSAVLSCKASLNWQRTYDVWDAFIRGSPSTLLKPAP